MRFLSVRPDFCRRLPSDSTSRWTPLPLAICFPSLGRIRDLHPLEHAHAGRTSKRVRQSNFCRTLYCCSPGRNRRGRLFAYRLITSDASVGLGLVQFDLNLFNTCLRRGFNRRHYRSRSRCTNCHNRSAYCGSKSCIRC